MDLEEDSLYHMRLPNVLLKTGITLLRLVQLVKATPAARPKTDLALNWLGERGRWGKNLLCSFLSITTVCQWETQY